MSSEFMERRLKKKEKEAEQKRQEEQSEEEEGNGKVVKVLRKSRKNFLAEYFCGVVLLGGVGIFHLQEINLVPWLKYLAIGAGLFALTYGEISRIFLRYVISEDKISIIKGLIKQSKKNVNYHPLAFIPDINMKQSRIQRFLNFGTVFVESGAASFEIRDIDRPRQVMQLIEDLIEKTRKGE